MADAGHDQGRRYVQDARHLEVRNSRMHGLYKTRWLKEGLEAYMKERGLKGTPEAMPIPPIHMLAPSFEKLKNFIAEGLASDCP